MLVADRHDLVRRGLRELVGVEPGFTVVGESLTATGTERELRLRRPTLLLLEPAVLGPSALRRLPELLRLSPLTRAVVLADELSPALDRHANAFGAMATVLKHAAPDELFRVLRHVMSQPPQIVPLAG